MKELVCRYEHEKKSDLENNLFQIEMAKIFLPGRVWVEITPRNYHAETIVSSEKRSSWFFHCIYQHLCSYPVATWFLMLIFALSLFHILSFFLSLSLSLDIYIYICVCVCGFWIEIKIVVKKRAASAPDPVGIP